MLKMIDFHVHVDGFAWKEFELASMCGVDILITAAYYPHKVEVTTSKILDSIEKIIVYDSWRAGMHSIKLFAGIGINPMSIPKDYNDFLQKMPRLFDKDSVVAIGEVGLDPRSETCTDMQIQIDILKKELEIAKELMKPVFIHIPPTGVTGVLEKDWKSYKNTKKILAKDIEIIKESKIDHDLILFDHLDESVIEIVLNQGFNAGITVQPWRGMSPTRASSIIKKFEHEYKRLFINSDFSDTLESDCLAVPKTAKRMREIGISEDKIDSIIWKNPLRFFKLRI